MAQAASPPGSDFLQGIPAGLLHQNHPPKWSPGDFLAKMNP